MPRTKRPVAARKVNRSLDPKEAAIRQQLEDIVDQQKKALEHFCEMEIKNIQMAFKILQNSLSEETMNKTIGQMKSELVLKERPKSNGLTSHAARSASHDDELSSASTATKRRRTRSVEQSRKTNARPTRPPATFKTPAVYKTPAYNKSSHNNFPVITPKVMPNTPMTVLRRPRQGEMVVSMSGSPLMVPTMNSESKANCNIPLFDGTVLSLQPEHLRQSSTFIPLSLMDKETLRQLKALKDNLDTVVRLGERGGKL